MIAPFFQITVSCIGGNLTTRAEHQGSVLLIFNVASAFGLTPQYAGLESIDKKFRTRGFVVLGSPCNGFAGQELDSHGGNPAALRDE